MLKQGKPDQLFQKMDMVIVMIINKVILNIKKKKKYLSFRLQKWSGFGESFWSI